jgi:hypothetical protein
MCYSTINSRERRGVLLKPNTGFYNQRDIMDKATFIHQLRRGLRLHFLPKEAQDILEDYEGFFLSGLAEGKTEEEISEGLGDPAQIIAELTQDGDKRSFLQRKDFWHLIASLMVFSGGVFYFWRIRYSIFYQGNVWISVIGIVLFSVGLWFAAGGTLSKGKDRSKPRKIIIFWHILLFAVIVFIYSMCMWFFPLVIWKSSWGFMSGPVITVILTLIFFFAAVIFVYAFYSFYCKSPDYFALVPHLLGVMALCSCTRNLLGHMTTPEGFYEAVNLSLIPYGVAVGLSFLVSIGIRREV